MRTTVDLPDSIFRRTKALAAVRGITLKTLILRAVERELNEPARKPRAGRQALPVVHLRHAPKLDLTGFNFDDLLP